MSMILPISFTRVLLVYARSIQRREMFDPLWNELRHVFTLCDPLKDFSAEHGVAGIVAKMELAFVEDWSPSLGMPPYI
jgi:hypothetical protein